MAISTKAYLGLGANLGDPVQQIIDARNLLDGWEGVHDCRTSDFYLSSPVGCADQPDYVNAVIEVSTDRSASTLFEEIQRIELALGRERCLTNQNAPRLIDIDFLLFGEQLIEHQDLQIPHPRLLERLFVLKPLADLISEHPLLGKIQDRMAEDRFANQQLRSMIV